MSSSSDLTLEELDRKFNQLLAPFYWWGWGLGALVFILSWFADPPFVLLYIDWGLAGLLCLFGALVFGVIVRDDWRRLKISLAEVLLNDSFVANRWTIPLHFFGGLIGFHLAVIIWRAAPEATVQSSFIELLAWMIIILLPAVGVLGASAIGVISGAKRLADAVTAGLAPQLYNFLETDNGEWSFYIAVVIILVVIMAWGYVGSFVGGILLLAIPAVGVGLYVFYSWLSDSESHGTGGSSMRDDIFSLSPQLLPTTAGVPELFDEARILADLQRVRDNPSLLGQYFGALRSRFTSRREVELINQWATQYKAGAQLIQAKTGVMRAATEYHGLERENLQKSAETEATIAKHQADQEEQITRAAKAKAERRRLEGGADEQQTKPSRVLPAHQEKLSAYESGRLGDKQIEFFEDVFLPTMAAADLDKAFEKQKTVINRDPGLNDSQKDHLVAMLTERYQTTRQRLKGSRARGKDSKDFIFEDES